MAQSIDPIANRRSEQRLAIGRSSIDDSTPSSVVVIGAGAAGLVAAIFAAKGGRRTLLLERTSDGGRKILISGGGRCNILPSSLEAQRFVTESPAHLVRGLLRTWPLDEQRRFFEREAGVPLALERETGKYFPQSNRARDVRDALVQLARSLGVEIRFHTTVTGLAPIGVGWRIEATAAAETSGTGESSGSGVDGAANDGGATTIDVDRVILATGGLSVPVTGSDGTGLRIAAALGHTIHDTYPALTPVLGSALPSLAGVSLHARLRARSHGKVTESHGGFLFTHRGYSGPAVLDLSHVLVRDRTATLRAAWGGRTAAQWQADLTRGSQQVSTILSRHLPARLAEAIVAATLIPGDRRVSDLRRTERTTLMDRLTSFELTWTGDEGFKKAEVTGGGLALTELDPRTLESRRHPGLFFCGEMLDAFGPIGGYNFVWAWVTGRAAGLGAARR
jgi:hypothetical protein